MTTYTSISNAAVAVGGIPSSSVVTALRDNPAAIAESANSAPILSAGWHPYDKVTVGDGATGLFYDFAIHGALTSIDTPAFADGWEYKILIRNAGYTSGSNRNFRFLFDTGTISSTALVASSAAKVTGDLEVLNARMAEAYRIYNWFNTFGDTPVTGDQSSTSTTKQSKVTFSWSGANAFASGKMYLLRRRDYRSL